MSTGKTSQRRSTTKSRGSTRKQASSGSQQAGYDNPGWDSPREYAGPGSPFEPVIETKSKGRSR